MGVGVEGGRRGTAREENSPITYFPKKNRRENQLIMHPSRFLFPFGLTASAISTSYATPLSLPASPTSSSSSDFDLPVALQVSATSYPLETSFNSVPTLGSLVISSLELVGCITHLESLLPYLITLTTKQVNLCSCDNHSAFQNQLAKSLDAVPILNDSIKAEQFFVSKQAISMKFSCSTWIKENGYDIKLIVPVELGSASKGGFQREWFWRACLSTLFSIFLIHSLL